MLLPFFRGLCDLDDGILVLVPFRDGKPKSQFFSVEKFSSPPPTEKSAPFLVCIYATTELIFSMIEKLEAPGPDMSPDRPGTSLTLARIVHPVR